MKVRAAYSKPSLCDCGDAWMHDNVPLGTEYIVETDTITKVTAQCHCGKLIECHSIFAIGGVSKSSGTLPLEILELDEGPVTQ